MGREEEEMEVEEEMESRVDQAHVRAGYRSLMDDITTNEEELGDVSGECHTKLRDYMEANENLFKQVIKSTLTLKLFQTGGGSARGSVGRTSTEAVGEAWPNSSGADVCQHHAVQPAGGDKHFSCVGSSLDT